jgi:hypothetical protein
VDDLLFRDLIDLLAYWKDFPPVHVAIAGLLRTFGDAPTAGTAAGQAANPASREDVRSFVGQFARGAATP